MSTPGMIPASFLNIQIHAVIDLALGAILFIFQVSLFTEIHDIYRVLMIH
jgi:hypothetical protein